MVKIDVSYSLRQRFLKFIMRRWSQNNHHLQEISCVYAMVEIDILTRVVDLVYVGSTTKLFSRYKSHKIPQKIQESGKLSLLFYLPMNHGFYDYEIKLIKKLNPIFNKQHRL